MLNINELEDDFEDEDFGEDLVIADVKTKKRKRKGPTIESVARDGILDKKTDDEIIEMVLEVFPQAKTSKSSISFYRSKLRKELGNDEVMTSRQAEKHNNPDTEEENKPKRVRRSRKTKEKEKENFEEGATGQADLEFDDDGDDDEL